MPQFAAATGVLSAITANWNMGFQTVHFLLFFPLVVLATYLLPGRLRRAWLLLASYYFYFFAAPRHLPILICGTLFSYLFCRLLSAAKKLAVRRLLLTLGIVGLVGGLAFFKYNAYFEPFFTPLFKSIGLAYSSEYFSVALAVGISFYTFTAIGSLIDAYRGDVPAEKNLITYALFLSFFPAVSQGPISRAGDLLPQLKTTPAFDAQNTINALRQFAIGYFKKMAVADTLAIYVKGVYGTPDTLASYSGITLIMASIVFMIQLYFDFSGYSDIALGTAQILGIRLPQNFNTPYFATNFSGFWSRWHISLSNWLQDYIFTPLVWSRWPEKLPFIGKKIQKPPVLTSLLAVFFVSGLWHGSSMLFVVWGLLQALFRIGEELVHRTLGKPRKKMPLLMRIGKTALVLVLWCESLVFFSVGLLCKGGTLNDALSALVRQFSGISFSRAASEGFSIIKTGFYGDDRIATVFILFCLVCTVLAFVADWVQFFKLKGKPFGGALVRLRPALRWGIYYLLFLCCFAAFIMQSGGFGGSSFLYGGF
ncbi:MAG: MBOAT family O-acyltransferase [Oscillospiraceae bacterium]